MPCRDGSDWDDSSLLYDRLDRATRLLCKMIARFGIIPGDTELSMWKAEHDQIDRLRLAAEEEERKRQEGVKRREEFAKEAAAKLTPEELEAIREQLEALRWRRT